MALSLKLRYELSNSDRILVFDDTGVYHAVNNPGGWGGSNPSISDASALSIQVKRPDTESLQVSSDSSMWTTVTPFNLLPNIGGIPYSILASDFGLAVTDTIPDGEYEFNASMTVLGVTYTYKIRKVFYYNAFKCKEQKKYKLDITCETCSDEIKNVMIMELGFDGIDYNVESGDTKSAVKILKVIKGMCCDCGCN